MKKKKGLIITLVVIVSILAILGLTVGITQGMASKLVNEENSVEELSSWMSYIKDDTLITNLVIPGSHDSGTYDMPWYGETQFKSIKEQLECGTRYFDLRAGKNKDKLCVIHGPVKGVDFEPILDDIVAFLNNNPTEFLILDFQKFSNDTANTVASLIEEKFGTKLVKKDSTKSELEFIKSLKLSDVRGKALIYWGVEDSNRDKDFVFSRNNDDGTRANSTLSSYYIGKLNKKSTKSYISNALPKYINMYKESDGGLFVLQGQLTDGTLICGPKYREYKHNENMNEYVKSLITNEDLQYINIIMRDFITDSKNQLTLELNITKNLVKTECIDKYNAMLNK